MTRIKHDQYAKQFLAGLLEQIGEVGTNREITGEPLHADLYFVPQNNVPKVKIKTLGLLGQMENSGACLLEPFRGQPTNTEIRTCLQKLFTLHNQLQRKQSKRAKQDDSQPKSIEEDELPNLWILATTASDRLLSDFGAILKEPHWYKGIYFCSKALKTTIISINRLPITPKTLFIRLLGKGKTQQQAIDEILAFPKDDIIRNEVEELLSIWRISIESKDEKTEDEEELLMNLSPVYQQWREKNLQQAMQQGVQQGMQQGMQQGGLEMQRTFIENLISARFGKEEMRPQIVDSLLQLSPEESSRLLIQISREELLAKFSH
jgi:hypothetical protein